MNAENSAFVAFSTQADSADGVVRGTLQLDRWTLSFQSATVNFKIPVNRLAILLGRGRDARIYFQDLDHPDLQCFTIDESILHSGVLGQSENLHRQVTSQVTRREIWRRLRVTLYFFLACGLVAWLGSLAMGLLVRSFVREIPVTWENKFGNAAMERLQSKLPFLEDTNETAQLAALAAPLVRAIPAHGIRFRFHILKSRFPNAFALPGGHIIVTTGLLKLADQPDELLGVIAHEAAHVTLRHAFRHLISGKGPAFILQILIGNRNRLLQAMAYPSEKLVYESFSQEYEREADSVGWDFLVTANINPHGMIDMFRKMNDYETEHDLAQAASAFDSHPALEKRIEWLQAKWARLPRKTGFLVLTNRVPESDAGAGTIFKPGGEVTARVSF